MQIKINVSANEFDNHDTQSNQRYTARVFERKIASIVLIIVLGDNAVLENSPRDSLKLEISTRRPRKENNPGVTQRYF